MRMDESKDTPLLASTSEAVTQNVRVEVESTYAPQHSQPFDQQWVFHYTVRITNEGREPVKLLTRHWIITEATGQTHEHKGDGVVDKQPELAPGQTFEYTSWCSLTTPSGVMRGTYQFVRKGDEHFDVEIAPFALHEPYTIH